MGLFDDLGGSQGIGLGLAGAGGTMERGAAALQGRLPQYDEAQVDIAGKKAALFKGILTEIEDLALSSVDDPNIIGPKLKQFQAIAKQAGINLDDNLIDHFTNNPMSLGMTFDPELTKGMTPQQTQILKRLQVEATRAGPRQMQAITKLDEIRTTRLIQEIQTQVRDLRSADPALGIEDAYIQAMNGKRYSTSPKMMAEAFKMMEAGDMELADARKKATVQGANTRTGILAAAADAIHPNNPVAKAKYVEDALNLGSGFDNKLKNDLLKKHSGDSTEAQKEFNILMGDKTAQQASQAEKAKLGIKQSEAYLRNQEDINERRQLGTTAGKPLEPATRKQLELFESLNRQMQILEDNYDPSFLGPIQGTEKAYNVRKQVGSYIGSPIGKKEENFRGALGIIQENFARAKEGAVIPAEMYNRLTGLVGRTTSEPQVFESSIGRFKDELGYSIKTVTRLGVTPRGRAGEAPTTAPSGGKENAPGSNVPPFSIDLRPGTASPGRKEIKNLTDGSTWTVPEKATREQVQMVQDWFASKKPEMGGGGGAADGANTVRSKSKSGKPMISYEGGKPGTWQYEK